MYKRPELDINALRAFIMMEANEKFPDKKGTPALKVMIEEGLKESIRYFYEVQCERKLYDRHKDKWYSQMKAHEMMEYLPEELYPNVIEWLDDKEISEIPYGDLSIKRIMHWHTYRGEPITHSFQTSAYAMGLYVKNGCRNIYDALDVFMIC